MTFPKESVPKRAKTVLCDEKVMCSIFLNAHVDYLAKSKTITGTYYVLLLDKGYDDIKTNQN